MTACILTRQGRNEAGYGRINIGGTIYLHHRVVFAEYHGLSIAALAGIVIRHTCDNPACVNPLHLVPGTHQDNVADRVARGRTAHGENHVRAKLTEEDVRAIRAAVREDGKVLAARYGVNEQCISKIRNRRTWRHVK